MPFAVPQELLVQSYTVDIHVLGRVLTPVVLAITSNP